MRFLVKQKKNCSGIAHFKKKTIQLLLYVYEYMERKIVEKLS